MEFFQIHVCTLCCACAARSCCGSDLFAYREKQLEWGRTVVQAERPSCLGFCMGERLHHMHSNSSMRCLVFPDRICLRVLYLSRPAFMFSAWIMSFTVFLVSSRALASSELKAWKCIDHSINTPKKILLNRDGKRLQVQKHFYWSAQTTFHLPDFIVFSPFNVESELRDQRDSAFTSFAQCTVLIAISILWQASVQFLFLVQGIYRNLPS